MSSISEDAEELPLINSDTSKGSSVSTDMQDEYNELLKYAVVIPKWTQQTTVHSTEPRGDMPMLRLQNPHDIPLTTVDQYSASSSSSSSRSNDCHDSAMGSEEIMTDRKTFREPDLKEQPHISAPISRITPVSAESSKVDPDVAQMNEQLKTWNVKFNNMVLSEFNQAKLGVVEHYQKLLYEKEMEHQAQVNKLQDEIEHMKELLHTYETSLGRKDSVISNLTRALQTSKERQDMMRALAQWKLRMNDEKRQSVATVLARRHRERVLAARAWQSWRALVEGNWREKVEKACQKKAQEVCMQLTDDYEEKMMAMNETIAASRAEVQRLNAEREKYEETMKKAFMRGVCALNLEAMSMFQNEEGAEDDVQSLSAAVDALSHIHGDHISAKIPGPRQIPVTSSESYPSVHHQQLGPMPTTVISQSVPSLPLSNSTLHNANGTPHARVQVVSNAAPLQPITTKFPAAKSRNAPGKSSTCRSGTKLRQAPTLNNIPANVLVKRHQPNLQNYITRKPLKHMAKYPNTPARPISGQ